MPLNLASTVSPSLAPLAGTTPLLAPARARCEQRDDGSFVLSSPEALGHYERCVGVWLERWARQRPDGLALAERAEPDEGAELAEPQAWRRLTWSELRQQVGAVAQSLLDMDLPPGDPVVVLSDNSIDHALLLLAAMHVGRPVCSVSSAYCRSTREYSKVGAILAALKPALVYASDAAVYGPALRACAPLIPGVRAVVLGQGAPELADVLPSMAFAPLLQTTETRAVRQAFDAIEGDDHAKYLLTSGSTGRPKVVINTHRMLCANQQMIQQAWPFLSDAAPVLLDWLPWSHTFGANHNLNLVLRHGGTLYIDDGRPAPGLLERTAANLRQVRPTLYFNVPRGLDMLLPLLETDADFARAALGRLDMLFYAGAALTSSTWQRLQAVAARVRDKPLWLTTSWGATETSPAVTSAHWWLDGAGNIGLPLPGMQLKFVPLDPAGHHADRPDGKYELRVRGVSVFPGYRGAPELSAQAFDDEGFYRIGDAGRLADPSRPEAGVLFAGRVAEDFKLASGTWVSVGALRLRLVSALAPYAQDAVLTGHDRDEIGALVFPSAAAGALAPDELVARLHESLTRLRAEGGGSASQVTRLRVLAEPPNADAGEITDKGYINQRAVLERRATDVAALHANADGNVLAAPPAHFRVNS
ncbi:MAG: feruloyl-CoA synthase [Chitinophagaceae bacterium]|nr:feruloyl-CoA synthase [Rubrivivax sp.]